MPDRPGRIIGNAPASLVPGSALGRFLPGTLPAAMELCLLENPNVTAATVGIDINFLTVKINGGALLPAVSLQASAQQSYETTLISPRTFGAPAVAQGSVPV